MHTTLRTHHVNFSHVINTGLVVLATIGGFAFLGAPKQGPEGSTNLPVSGTADHQIAKDLGAHLYTEPIIASGGINGVSQCSPAQLDDSKNMRVAVLDESTGELHSLVASKEFVRQYGHTEGSQTLPDRIVEGKVCSVENPAGSTKGPDGLARPIIGEAMVGQLAKCTTFDRNMPGANDYAMATKDSEGNSSPANVSMVSVVEGAYLQNPGGWSQKSFAEAQRVLGMCVTPLRDIPIGAVRPSHSSTEVGN